MTERDLLSQAAHALRHEHTGQRAGSGFTRAQIMKRLHQKRRRRLLRWLGFTPVAALVAGTAWAQATDAWPVVWRTVSDSVSAAMRLATNDPSEQVATVNDRGESTQAPLPSSAESSAAATEAFHTAPSEKNEVNVSTPQAPPGDVKSDGKPSVHRSARVALKTSARLAPSTATARPAPSAAKPLADQELLDFRQAHNAHFGSGPRAAAITLYQRYLAQNPNGRFIPEARYNLALLHLGQGLSTLAKKELLPFANGSYGGYRQPEAQAILEAIERNAKP